MRFLPRDGWLVGLGLMLALTPRGVVAENPAVAEKPAMAGSPAVAEKPAPKPVYTTAQLARLVMDLDDDSFAVRERAMRQLREAGAPAIAPLSEAARSGNLEVTLRAFRVLSSLYAGGSLEDYEAAETVLEELRTSEQSAVAQRAETALASMSEVRETRAIAAIQRLGGIVQYDDLLFGVPPGMIVPDERRVSSVILGKRWKGKQAGLKYLARIPSLNTLYVVEGTFPQDVLARVERDMPQFKVQLRGAACLGVGGSPHHEGCMISLVKPGSAAEKAGLRSEDVMVAFDGRPEAGEKDENGEKKLLDFELLVNLIKAREAGDTVPVKIHRPGQKEPLVLNVILDEWK